ncbi:hypothetical protein SERLA73DRAFT_56205, partial [Serpula lacrymans var. lacrymans S7.3]
GARKCKTSAGGVRRYQDSKDKASTANLKHHAIGCWGQETVDAVFGGQKANPPSGSIFSAFACKGQQPVQYTHRAHTNTDLLSAGRPNIELPSHFTISRDIQASFEKCQEQIGNLLQEHPGHLHFATDAWTSPNHHAFIAWTVHLEYNGQMICFLLDIIEVAKVCRVCDVGINHI